MRVAGFAADRTVVIPQQAIMIPDRDAPRYDFFTYQRGARHRAEFRLYDFAKSLIFHRISEQDRQVPGARIMIGCSEAVGIGEVTIGSTEIVRFFRHHLTKSLPRAGDTFGQ